MEQNENPRQQRETYEKLLFRRDKVEKEATEYKLSFIAEFGELLTERFRRKISCIEKKKIIAFCQAAVNQGHRVDVEKMNRYIDAVMKEYREELDELISAHKLCSETTPISENDYLTVKRIYRKIAKKIHPDLHPGYENNPELAEHWTAVMNAYHCNDLRALERLDIQTDVILRDLGEKVDETVIPDIEQKTAELEAEIERITTTDPYLYKLILEDQKQISEYKEHLREEIEEYINYERKLTEIIRVLIEGGAQFTWET